MAEENPGNPLRTGVQPSAAEDLGIRLHGRLPPAISEIIANSWDADASKVSVDLPDGDTDGDSAITVADGGAGMTYEGMQKEYLAVGRKRRTEEQCSKTPKGRKLRGRKGIGKLSVFGAARTVEIKTVKDGAYNAFRMNADEMLGSARVRGEYEPQIIARDERTGELNGTTVTLKSLRRKTPIDAE